MTEPPAQIRVGPFRYTVTVSRERMVELNRNRIGETDHQKLTMTVDSTLAPDHLAETLTHELLHGVLYVANMDQDDDAKAEDAVARLAPLLLDTLRRNPQLVAFLMDEGEIG